VRNANIEKLKIVKEVVEGKRQKSKRKGGFQLTEKN